MERIIEKRKRVIKKNSGKSVPNAVDPFAAVVDKTPDTTGVARKALTKVAPVKAETKPVRKTVRKSAKTFVADPFAEVVTEATSPVKRRSVKTAARKKQALVSPEREDVATSKPKKASPNVGLAKEIAQSTKKKSTKKVLFDVIVPMAANEPKVEPSPVFRALAELGLPELARDNRARLQMQTPTRLYFYWSVKENPWATLRNVFGDDLGSYALVLKLIDKKHGYEIVQLADAAGNYWFDVEPNGSYQTEIGFYAPNRPYFRILHSNTVETPRRSPSPHAATDADWNIKAEKFAEVLEVAGFSRDAFDVAMAGDDPGAAVNASHVAFTSFVGAGNDLLGISAEDLRYAMLALASGVTLEDLRHKVSAALFSILQANADKLEAGRAMSALTDHFDIDEAELTEEQFGSAVFGASLINFPRTLKTRTVSTKGYTQSSPRYNPVSSHSFR